MTSEKKCLISQTLSETTDGVVALVHSGEEYAEEPTPNMRRVGARAVAAGAFLVIGNHPHVAQARSTTSLNNLDILAGKVT